MNIYRNPNRQTKNKQHSFWMKTKKAEMENWCKNIHQLLNEMAKTILSECNLYNWYNPYYLLRPSSSYIHSFIRFANWMDSRRWAWEWHHEIQSLKIISWFPALDFLELRTDQATVYGHLLSISNKNEWRTKHDSGYQMMRFRTIPER